MIWSVADAMCVVLSATCFSVVSGKPALTRDHPEIAAVKQEADPQLHLSVSKKEFRGGEVIPLDLSFTSSTPERYQVSLASYDRSGRMSHDQFLVEPREGTSDPVELYFNSAWGFLCGGLFSIKVLSKSPITIHLDLNEWVRFDRPGVYRLTVVSHRVSDTQASNYPQNAGIVLKSNPVELHIISADSAWQHNEFKRIVAALSQTGLSGGDMGNDPKQTARKALRYLGTEEAAREMARRLRGEDNQADWDYMFGLIGSPHRDAGLQEMNKLFKDPEFPVSGLFLTTMSVLPLDPREPPASLRRQRDENLKASQKELVSALSNKRGKALAIGLNTVMLSMGPTMAPELKGKLVPQLIRVFPELPTSDQVTWLKYRWQQVKCPEWLPLLRTLALHYEDFPELRRDHAYQSLQLSGAALTDWYEIDPAGARKAVIAEITRPKPRYDATVLGILPDMTLPDVEEVLAEHLLATDNYEIEGNLTSLLFRYADRSVLQDVLGKVEGEVGKWACEPQDQALAYVLKVNPATAKPLIERAIAARGPDCSACRHMLLTDIGVLQNSSVLEEVAVESLSDADPEVANNAANFLGRYGSADAEQALWKRYEAWSQEWKGRAAELRYVPMKENPHLWDANLGQSLAHALATGSSWFSDEKMLHRIESLGVGTNIQGDIDQALQALSRRPFSISYIGSVPPRFNIAQYEQLSLESLMNKLTQFPRGTKFVFPPSNPTPSPEELKAREAIFQFSAKNGISMMCAH